MADGITEKPTVLGDKDVWGPILLDYIGSLLPSIIVHSGNAVCMNGEAVYITEIYNGS
jgi:hypothetical protein